MPEDIKSFGRLLAKEAELQGVTQAELAKRMGITQHRVSQIFRSPNITEEVFRRGCEALGVKPEVRLVWL